MKLLVTFVYCALLAVSVAAQDAPKRAEKAFKDAEKRATKKETYRDAIERFREAAAAYKEAGDATGQVKSLVRAGWLYASYGEQPAEALALHSQALEIARTAGDRALEAEALEGIAAMRRRTKDVEGSVAAYKEVVAIREALGNKIGVAAAFSNIGLIYKEAGDEARATEYRVKAAEYRKQHGLPATLMRVSGGVLTKRAIKRAQPPYPEEVRNEGIQGSVEVEVTVATDGTVEAAKALSGPPALRDAAVEAARKWTFEPLVLNGEPARLAGTLTFHFRRS